MLTSPEGASILRKAALRLHRTPGLRSPHPSEGGGCVLTPGRATGAKGAGEDDAKMAIAAGPARGWQKFMAEGGGRT